MCGWPWPVIKHPPATCSLLPAAEWERELEKQKACGLRWGWLNKWGKKAEKKITPANQTPRPNGAKGTIYHLSQVGRCSVSLWAKSTLEILPSSLYCWVWWSLWLVCVSSPCWPLPPSAYSLWSLSEKQRRPSRCASAVQPQLKHWCVISIVLVTDLKYSTIQAAVKKVKSSQPNPVQYNK